MDRLHTMAVFVAVAEEGGFAAAGRRLSISPPAVTRAVTALEDILGARLLHRTTRQVRLTSAGQQYLTDCRRILQEVDDADRAAAGIHSLLQGNITVTASALFGRMVVAPLLFDFLDQHPDVSVTTLFVDRVVNLIDEGADVAVRIAELPDSSLSAIRVGSVRRVLCASPEYLEKHGTPADPADLDRHNAITFSAALSSADWQFNRNGKTTSFRPVSRLKVNVADVAIAAAARGRGITRVLSYMIAPQLESGELQLVLEAFAPPPVPVHVVHKETGHTSARVRAVFDHLARHLKDEPRLHQDTFSAG